MLDKSQSNQANPHRYERNMLPCLIKIFPLQWSLFFMISAGHKFKATASISRKSMRSQRKNFHEHTHTTDGKCFYSAIEFVYQIDFISSASFNSHRWLPSDSLEHYGWNIKRTSAISRAIWNFSDILFFHLQLNL